MAISFLFFFTFLPFSFVKVELSNYFDFNRQKMLVFPLTEQVCEVLLWSGVVSSKMWPPAIFVFGCLLWFYFILVFPFQVHLFSGIVDAHLLVSYSTLNILFSPPLLENHDFTSTSHDLLISIITFFFYKASCS